MIAQMQARSRLGALLAVLGMIAFLTFTPAMLGASQANAIPGVSDCKDAPSPDIPGTGPAYWFLPVPDPAPPSGDPFAQQAKTTIYQQYGFAGITFQTYDLGCGGFARDPMDNIMNGTSNLLMQIPVMIVGFTGWVLDAAFHPENLFGSLDNYMGSATKLLREKVFNVWSIPLILAGCLWLMMRARRRELGALGAWAATMVGLVALLSVLSSYPQTAGHAVDSVVSGTIGQVASGFAGQDAGPVTNPADSTIANLHRAVLYGPWLSGTFGNQNSAAAKQYGPALFDSAALTWQQANMSPDDRKKVIEDKQKSFEDTMQKIKDQDSSIYEIAQGKKPADRFGATVISGFGATVSSTFLLVSGLLMLVAFMIVRLAVIMAPVIVVLGLFPPLWPRVRAVGEGVFTALIGCIAFGVGAALDTLLVGQVMAPGSSLTPIRQILLVFLLAVAFFFILAPFLRVHRAFRNAMDRAVNAGTEFGRQFRDGLRDDSTPEQRAEWERQRQERSAANRRRPEAEPVTPLVAQAARFSGGGVAPPWRREQWANSRSVERAQAPALPSTTQRALPAGVSSAGTSSATTGAARASTRPAPVPVEGIEPDAIYRPSRSRSSGADVPSPPRPSTSGGMEGYDLVPYESSRSSGTRPEGGGS